VRYIVWGLGTVAALCTAYYMFRLVFLTFFGTFRGTHEQEHHLHESPATMTIPLIVLATLSTVGGLALAWHHNLARWLEPIYPELGGKGNEFAIENEYMLMGVAVAVAALGTWLAYSRFYKRGLEADAQFESNSPALARAIENKWYVDEFYSAVIVRPLEKLSIFFWRVVDAIIDGLAAMLGYVVQGFGDLLRFFQTGNVRNYALMLFLGVIVFIWVIA
jgi:NADH-quinone oxidoreductase subunit L